MDNRIKNDARLAPFALFIGKSAVSKSLQDVKGPFYIAFSRAF